MIIFLIVCNLTICYQNSLTTSSLQDFYSDLVDDDEYLAERRQALRAQVGLTSKDRRVTWPDRGGRGALSSCVKLMRVLASTSHAYCFHHLLHLLDFRNHISASSISSRTRFRNGRPLGLILWLTSFDPACLKALQ